MAVARQVLKRLGCKEICLGRVDAMGLEVILDSDGRAQVNVKDSLPSLAH